MKLYLACIPLFLITYQNIDWEKDVTGKYIGHFLGKHEFILKDNGKFVSKGYSLVPQRDEPIYRDPHMPSPMGETKKRGYRTKGSWVYFKKDSLDGVLLKTENQTDSLFFLENGNLSPNNPNVNNRYGFKAPEEYVKQ